MWNHRKKKKIEYLHFHIIQPSGMWENKYLNPGRFSSKVCALHQTTSLSIGFFIFPWQLSSFRFIFLLPERRATQGMTYLALSLGTSLWRLKVGVIGWICIDLCVCYYLYLPPVCVSIHLSDSGSLLFITVYYNCLSDCSIGCKFPEDWLCLPCSF